MSRSANGLLVVCALAVLLFGVTGAHAQITTTVTLDAGTVPPSVMCGDVWMEAGVLLSFVPTVSPDDCGGGSCFFGIGGFDPNGVDLFPARLRVDLLPLPGTVVSAEVDILDGCGINCTRAHFYDAGGTLLVSDGNTFVGSPGETLTLDASALGTPTTLAVSSCEGGVLEIRITYLQTVPVDESTWGAVKALFK